MRVFTFLPIHPQLQAPEHKGPLKKIEREGEVKKVNHVIAAGRGTAQVCAAVVGGGRRKKEKVFFFSVTKFQINFIRPIQGSHKYSSF